MRAGRVVFSGIDFDVGAGEVVELRGANGSGKSSLLRLLCGLIVPWRGEVRWHAVADGVPSAAAKPQSTVIAVTSYLGHADGLRPELTARENLDFSLRVAGLKPSEADYCDALGRLCLEGRKDEPVRFFSQGQRRRLALARVVLSGKPLWLLDEPHTGLDADGERALDQALDEHLRRGGSALIATHRERRTESGAPRCVLMR